MIASSWQQVAVAGSTMRMHVSAPPGSGPFAAVVVIQHQGGVDEFVQHTTRAVGGGRLCGRGTGSLSPRRSRLQR